MNRNYATAVSVILALVAFALWANSVAPPVDTPPAPPVDTPPATTSPIRQCSDELHRQLREQVVGIEPMPYICTRLDRIDFRVALDAASL